MQNVSLKKRNNGFPQQPKQSDQTDLTTCGDYKEANRQLLLLKEQLLKEREKAEERDRIKSAFLANMVHEIRTPMSAIMSFAELILSTNIAAENKIKYAQIIYQCTDGLLNLINDLLDISKIEAGQLTIVEKSGNIKNMFNELFDLFNTPTVENKSEMVQLKYCIDLKNEQCLINTDFVRLKQVLINLISNALKFTEKGHVLFGCRLIDRKTLCFYVEDTGIGITSEKQTIIFERYKQINNNNSAKMCKGTGLGLSIVKSLVELMNGKVWVESEEGKGSKFSFTLPFKKCKLKIQKQCLIEL